MAIKNMNYFQKFNLEAAANQISKMGSAHERSGLFGDAIQALLLKAQSEIVTVQDLYRILGKPDVERKEGKGVIVEYRWIDTHDSTEYSSATPFLVVDGIVKGLAGD